MTVQPLDDVGTGDGETCRACGKPLGDPQTWQRGFDGAATHLVCLPPTDEEDHGD